MKLYVGADHRGIVLKEALKESLSQYGEVLDVGADSLHEQDDFVDFAKRVSLHITGQSEAMGVLFCGTGVGMAIAANKFPGVRAAVGHESEEIRLARHDDDINVLCLSADTITQDKARELIEVFLSTPFSREERFLRRIAKLKELEEYA